MAENQNPAQENCEPEARQHITPLMLSIIAVTGSLLIPVIGGLSCLLFGFDSPTDGGTVTGSDAFLVGLILGFLAAGPPVVVSIVSLALSLKNRHSLPQKSGAYILPCIALGIMLLFVSSVFGLGKI